MKKLFIFDFDGTLFDSVNDVVSCFNKALTIHGLPTLTRDEYLECLGGNIDEIVSLVLGQNDTNHNHEAVKKTYLDLYNSSEKLLTVPFSNVHDVLRELQEENVVLAINSNRLSYSLIEFVNRFFGDIDFLEIEGHNHPHPSKPHPYGVNKIIKKAGVGLNEALYVGDSSTDIMTAKNAGIDCVIVKWGYGYGEVYSSEYPIAVIDEISQIKQFINYF